jgi:hypothetical protein
VRDLIRARAIAAENLQDAPQSKVDVLEQVVTISLSSRFLE